MDSNFQKCTLLESSAGDLEQLKGETYWREPRTWRPKGNIVGGLCVSEP